MTYAVEVDGPDGAGWARDLRHVFRRALRLHRARSKVTPATFSHRRVRIERATDRRIFGFPIGVGEAWQLQKRYRRHRDTLFVCLHRDDVEPTNNGSERDLRNSVIHDSLLIMRCAVRRADPIHDWPRAPTLTCRPLAGLPGLT